MATCNGLAVASTGSLSTASSARLGGSSAASRDHNCGMNKREWLKSGAIIFVLIFLATLVAQSRRNCEVPGSSWLPVPCIWGEPLKKHSPKFQ